ncbi:penicillin-binding protein [[Clostridium] scindens]|nr:penicillin-binding protein [[Clostridium] scindens]BDF20415.1 penicillin-binding protein [[Clostridium] scindens]
MSRKERKEANRKDKQKAKAKRARNKEFARVTYIFVALFLVLMGYITYFQVARSRDIIRSPYNARQDSYADRVVRGKILDKEGNVLAQTNVSEDGTETREYPYGNMFAHVVGYSVQGKSGLESVENFELLTSNAFFLEKIKNEFQDKKNMGDSVVTTLNLELQEAAYDALGNYKGAVVVMEPSTGKILAMVSKPDFDPNTVAENWDFLNTDQDSVLLNRATQGQYAPGSAFKVVTALEYMRENPDYENYGYNCTGAIEKDGVTIRCYNGHVHGQVGFQDSLAYSCNTSFSNIGLSLDIKNFRETSKELLFNSKLPSVLPYSKSSFSLEPGAGSADKMMTAMGQGKTQVSPYHMALITSAIANGGTLMKPYLVDSVTNYTGAVIDKNKPEKYKSLMTSEDAAKLKQYMSAVVDYGTASVLSGQSYTAAGKTGTAEYSSDKEKDHSWFIGMTNVDNPELVISVIIESSDGTAKAVDVAKQVFDAYYY